MPKLALGHCTACLPHRHLVHTCHCSSFPCLPLPFTVWALLPHLHYLHYLPLHRYYTHSAPFPCTATACHHLQTCLPAHRTGHLTCLHTLPPRMPAHAWLPVSHMGAVPAMCAFPFPISFCHHLLSCLYCHFRLWPHPFPGLFRAFLRAACSPAHAMPRLRLF